MKYSFSALKNKIGELLNSRRKTSHPSFSRNLRIVVFSEWFHLKFYLYETVLSKLKEWLMIAEIAPPQMRFAHMGLCPGETLDGISLE